jgi:hypothetical protein
VKHAISLGAGLLLCSVLATPQAAPVVPPPHVHASRAPLVPRASLYSPRVRRLVQGYLRMRLLETREADLDRARLVIEHQLGVGALLGETPPPKVR